MSTTLARVRTLRYRLRDLFLPAAARMIDGAPHFNWPAAAEVSLDTAEAALLDGLAPDASDEFIAWIDRIERLIEGRYEGLDPELAAAVESWRKSTCGGERYAH